MVKKVSESEKQTSSVVSDQSEWQQWHRHTLRWWKIRCIQFELFWLCKSPNFIWESDWYMASAKVTKLNEWSRFVFTAATIIIIINRWAHHLSETPLTWTSLSEYAHIGKETKQHLWVYPHARELSPMTVEGHGTEAMAQSQEREQWFDFGMSFSKKRGQPKLKSLALAGSSCPEADISSGSKVTA